MLQRVRTVPAFGSFALLATCAGGQVGPEHAQDYRPASVTAAPAPAPTSAPEAHRDDTPIYEPDPSGHAVAILRANAPNIRYAALDAASCEAELGRREVPFVRAAATPGVLDPVRLRGPLHGVTIHSPLGPSAQERSLMEIFDCRLVLALDDFAAQVVGPRGVVEMTHLSAYRSRASYGCTPKYAGKQHCAALAVDVAKFTRKDGSVLDVERDFHGHPGQSSCTGGAHPNPPSPAAAELWGFVCDAAARGLFHVILTPNYNAEHHNHFHLEITPDAGWMLIR